MKGTGTGPIVKKMRRFDENCEKNASFSGQLWNQDLFKYHCKNPQESVYIAVHHQNLNGKDTNLNACTKFDDTEPVWGSLPSNLTTGTYTPSSTH